MKEMCRNFICNGCMQKNDAQPAALQPDTTMGDCNACVTERVGLAQAFIPTQTFAQPMEQEQSLVCGTAFSALAMPYCSGWNLYRFGREA